VILALDVHGNTLIIAARTGAALKKIKSGIFGLNPLLDGGFNEASTTVVIGRSGAGKTTFATQFIRRGLHEGQEGIFVSLDENKEQIIREAVEMGWSDILEYLDDELLVFIDASGREFGNFIRKELPAFVAHWEGAKARIAVDPLTPVMWSTKDTYEQRELIGFMLKETRRVGTVLCTLEEHGAGDLTTPETVIPMYLADCVIHLRYESNGGSVAREMKIVKARSSRHSQLAHPYTIVRGLGLIVEPGEYHRLTTTRIPALIKQLLQRPDLPKPVTERLERMLEGLTDDDFRNLKPEQILDLIRNEYGTG
jgi:circadian clock protein KaiC